MSTREEEVGGIVDYDDGTRGNNNQDAVKVYRLPVELYKDDKTGEQFFYLQKSTFPGRTITDLKIRYSESEKSQVKEQVLADKTCPEIMLHKARVECHLGGKSENDDPNESLKDESFRLSGSKIGAIRMRMYATQKLEAQKQLEDPTCEMIGLTLDIECRLVSKKEAAPPTQE